MYDRTPGRRARIGRVTLGGSGPVEDLVRCTAFQCSEITMNARVDEPTTPAPALTRLLGVFVALMGVRMVARVLPSGAPV